MRIVIKSRVLSRQRHVVLMKDDMIEVCCQQEYYEEDGL